MKKALLLALALCAASVFAQGSPPPMRLRGTIEKVDPTTLVVRERNGQTMTLAIADNFTVSEVMPVDLLDRAAQPHRRRRALGEHAGGTESECEQQGLLHLSLIHI